MKKKTKEGYTLWPYKYLSKEEMEYKLNHPEQKEKAEHSTMKEHRIQKLKCIPDIKPRNADSKWSHMEQSQAEKPDSNKYSHCMPPQPEEKEEGEEEEKFCDECGLCSDMQKCIIRCAEKEKKVITIATDATRTERGEDISQHTYQQYPDEKWLDETTEEEEEGKVGKEGNPYTTNARRIMDNPFEKTKMSRVKFVPLTPTFSSISPQRFMRQGSTTSPERFMKQGKMRQLKRHYCREGKKET